MLVAKAAPPEDSPDVRAAFEASLQALACSMREYPTLPCDKQFTDTVCTKALSTSSAHPLPAVSCAFKHCSWAGSATSQLSAHLHAAHKLAFLPALQSRCLGTEDDDWMLNIYHSAITRRCQQHAPTSTLSFQCRCTEQCWTAVQGTNLQSPVCFLCACSFPYVRGRQGNAINWHTPFGQGKVCGISRVGKLDVGLRRSLRTRNRV